MRKAISVGSNISTINWINEDNPDWVWVHIPISSRHSIIMDRSYCTYIVIVCVHLYTYWIASRHYTMDALTPQHQWPVFACDEVREELAKPYCAYMYVYQPLSTTIIKGNSCRECRAALSSANWIAVVLLFLIHRQISTHWLWRWVWARHSVSNIQGAFGQEENEYVRDKEI